MSSVAAKRLTDRQRAVMERIDRRVPVKVIAQELGVSDTRINQHIRALKDAYAAGSLGELVENYRATLAREPDGSGAPDAVPGAVVDPGEADDNGAHGAADGTESGPLSEPAYIKTQINLATNLTDFGGRDDPGRLVLSDAMPLIDQVPWLRPGEPRVVPARSTVSMLF